MKTLVIVRFFVVFLFWKRNLLAQQNLIEY